MKTNLPKRNVTRTLILGLVFLFFGTYFSYGQDELDGNYCPLPGTEGDEYGTGIFFTDTIDPNASATCEIEQIWAKLDTANNKVRLAFKIGNGGSAIFRLYADVLEG